MSINLLDITFGFVISLLCSSYIIERKEAGLCYLCIASMCLNYHSQVLVLGFGQRTLAQTTVIIRKMAR